MIKTQTHKNAEEYLARNETHDTKGKPILQVIKDEEAAVRAIEIEAAKPLVTDEKRVEIIVLITQNDRDIVIDCIKGILLSPYPFKITIYDNTANTRNTSKAWNKLIKESTCGYVMVIDSDAFPQNHYWLEAMVKLLEKYPDAAVVGPVAGEPSVTTIQSMAYKEKAPEILTDGHISGYCMLFRKSIFEKVGYFDEDFVFYGQESDWIEKILEERKYQVLVTRQAWVKHGIAGKPSVSADRAVEAGVFNKRADSEYSQALWIQKKEQRMIKKNNP